MFGLAPRIERRKRPDLGAAPSIKDGVGLPLDWGSQENATAP